MWWVSKAVRVVLEALKAAHQEHVTQLQAQVVVLQKELIVERQKVLGLERALAVSQGNVDWMRHYANALSADRQSLAAAKGLDLPAPRFEGQLQTAADVEARATAAARAREAGGGAPVEVGRAIETADDVDAAMAAYTGHVNGFEDVGDEEAERQGIVHNEADGTVEYRRK
jgi:hypothetical protein